MSKTVYRFGGGQHEGNRTMKTLLGGKGANLAEMAAAGLPIPAGFTISTEVCQAAAENDGNPPAAVWAQVQQALRWLEQTSGRAFGGEANPLLVSVRSGAAVSMPGMMDTVLNLGQNLETATRLAADPSRARFAWDCFRRFIDMFGTVVVGVPHEAFEAALEAQKEKGHKKEDSELDAAELAEVSRTFLGIYERHTSQSFPHAAEDQLRMAVQAVFLSYNSDRAIKYRQVQQIRGLLGTAVTVQAMVFGNRGSTSGTGVCFTRNPATGEKGLYGEYLVDAQGEDVVAGIRTPLPISKLEADLPEAYRELVGLCEGLEAHFCNMQDIEFTIEENKLYLLQTRTGKRTGAAAVRIACDLVDERVATPEQAVLTLVEPRHIDQMLHPHFLDEVGYRKAGRVLTKGLPASPGAAVGKLVFTAEDAEAAQARGEEVILARTETSPEDVGGMHAARGIITTRGGMTSHAAVVARGWGKPCVAGCSEAFIDSTKRLLRIGGVTLGEGDVVSINGTTGEIIRGAEALTEAKVSAEFQRIMQWADGFRRLRIRANADTPHDARTARELGAEGIGLCRTEHMFFDPARILSMRKMILATEPAARKAALAEILPYQRADFEGLFEAMAGLPVTIRLLDPPLHEFLPQEATQQHQVAMALGMGVEPLRARLRQLEEQNPMLGHRGCRLGLTHPEITEMQARALFEAACAATQRGHQVFPEVMVPLIVNDAEFVDQAAIVRRVASAVLAEHGVQLNYKIGTMIETPRAALVAGSIAKRAEFFSFGTNDLTQMTFGFSRDDVGSFLPAYLQKGVLQDDPFQSLDTQGVGQLVTAACQAARRENPSFSLGICGEHGGDPRSIAFFAQAGLDYVSCSPLRVPVARLAAAQAELASRTVSNS